MIKTIKVIISGGGTGGHIFPAIAIADALTRLYPQVDILFVGAKGKMEMEKVPDAGYRIIGLPVAGFQRRLTLKNVTFFFKLASSIFKARSIIRGFKPDVVVGVGGYASGPVLRAASSKKIPTLIQEQNSFPGITNRILAKKALVICVAYSGMERFFDASKIVITGNPVRQNLTVNTGSIEAYNYFGLNPELKTILVIGGSLGARSINNGILNQVRNIKESNTQVIWQTGKIYFDEIEKSTRELGLSNLVVVPFIKRMDLAYSVADVVVSRAGAGTISELALLKKAVILVPSPNVSEDHQTRNAMALVVKNAAIMVKDSDSSQKLLSEALKLINNNEKIAELEKNIKEFAIEKSDEIIAKNVIKLANAD